MLYFAIHPLAFDSIIYWSHNSFSYPAGALLALGLLTTLRTERHLTWQRLTLLGFGMGVLAAVQLYFITWVAGAAVGVSVYFHFQGHGRRRASLAGLNVGAASLAGFVVATSPIIKRYPEFASWILSVIGHQGRHSSGPPGLISLPLAVSNFLGLWNELRLLFLTIGIVLTLLGIAFVIHRRTYKLNAGLWAAALGLTVQLTCMTALVIKHPAVKYMQAVAATLPLLLAIGFILWNSERPRIKSSGRLLKLALSTLIFFGFAVNLYRSIIIRSAVTRQVESAVADIDAYTAQLAREVGRDRQSMTALWVYGTPSECWAKWYGNRHADYVLSAEITSQCPRDLELDIFMDRVSLPDGTMVPVDEVEWDVIVTTEASLNDYPTLAEHGEPVYSQARLGTFGKIVYLLPPEVR
ncbi:MAG: hypothetical protein GTO14_03310 [Anaerolineales bacterium]|nr:hypothetical protein [Anaerolineales bacterium]